MTSSINRSAVAQAFAILTTASPANASGRALIGLDFLSAQERGEFSELDSRTW